MKNNLFTHICSSIDVCELLDEGVLSPLRSFGSKNTLDLSKIGKRGGEFKDEDIEAEFAEKAIPIVEEIISRGQNRKSWLLFTVTVNQALLVKELMIERGVSVALVTGETPKKERERIIADYLSGQVRCIVNCNVLTTGFDAPSTDLVALIRATMSPVLYVQMLGRGMRIAEGKKDCLVLDYGLNCERHGPINDLRIKSSDETGNPVTKECPKCEAIIPAAKRECECGYIFPEVDRSEGKGIVKTAQGNKQFIANKKKDPVRWLDVNEMEFHRHVSRKGSESVRIDYHCGYLLVSEWFSLSSKFSAGRMGALLRQMRYMLPVLEASPDVEYIARTLSDAYARGLLDPIRSILVDTSGKYTEVKSRSIVSIIPAQKVQTA